MRNSIERFSFTVEDKIYPLIFDLEEASTAVDLEKEINFLFSQKNAYYQNKLDKETVYLLIIFDLLLKNRYIARNDISIVHQEIQNMITKVSFFS